MILRRYRGFVLFALVLFVFSTGGLFASADDKTSVRRVGLTQINRQLLVTFSFRDAFPPKIQKQLSSGLKTGVLIQLTLERQGSTTPFAYWAQTVEITYDLWEDKYLIQREDDTGRRRASVTSKQTAIDLAAELSHVRLVDTSSLPEGVYRIRAKIETNPVSKEMLGKIRSWLVKSQSKSAQNSTPSNYFGSFVGALVDRRIGEADHTINFVSQWFKPGEP
jgi:hypothetical protein